MQPVRLGPRLAPFAGMMLPASTLLALWMLASPASQVVPTVDTAPTVPRVEGRVDRHTDLDGDGVQEVFVSLPDACDDDGRCRVMVLQPLARGGYRVLLGPTEVWDLAPASDHSRDGWVDLVEARREGPAMDDITLVRWQFDGERYVRVEATRRVLPSTPDWLS